MTGMHKCCEGHVNIELIGAAFKKGTFQEQDAVSLEEQKLTCCKVQLLSGI